LAATFDRVMIGGGEGTPLHFIGGGDWRLQRT